MQKGKRTNNVANKNEEVKGKSSEKEEIKIPKCSRKGHIETVNEETKDSSSVEEDIGIRRCRKRRRVDNMNKEVKGWTSLSKQQESPPEITNNKEDIHLEQMKRKVKRVALEWDDFVLQEHLKYLMYIQSSLRGDK